MTHSGMQVKSPCDRPCQCDDSVFAPICTSKGETYFSACHAGCANLTSSLLPVGNSRNTTVMKR